MAWQCDSHQGQPQHNMLSSEYIDTLEGGEKALRKGDRGESNSIHER
jgi:hypothetical protein